MTRKLQIQNFKGGVGKTTTAVNLSHGLALRNRRVLLIDLDQQGNASDMLGLKITRPSRPSTTCWSTIWPMTK